MSFARGLCALSGSPDYRLSTHVKGCEELFVSFRLAPKGKMAYNYKSGVNKRRDGLELLL